jgi:hypothetical protein
MVAVLIMTALTASSIRVTPSSSPPHAGSRADDSGHPVSTLSGLAFGFFPSFTCKLFVVKGSINQSGPRDLTFGLCDFSDAVEQPSRPFDRVLWVFDIARAPVVVIDPSGPLR